MLVPTQAHASPCDCHWTEGLLDPEANAREMEPCNRTNDQRFAFAKSSALDGRDPRGGRD